MFCFTEKRSCRSVAVWLVAYGIFGADSETIETAHTAGIVDISANHFDAGSFAYVLTCTTRHATVGINLYMIYVMFVEKPHCCA